MPRFHIAAVLLCLSALVVPHQASASASVKGGKGGNKCGKADASKLGNPNLKRYDASYDLEVSTGKVDCDFTFTFTFKHDEDLPIPDAAAQCNPMLAPPAFAPDGIPYLASRFGYESMPKDIQEATGIDHLSLDFNPCGHPPVDVFNIPHYDMHVYLISPEDRMCMTCDKVPGAPVCLPPPGPNTMAGNGFFNIAKLRDEILSNMPSEFKFSDGDAVPYMGMHAWDFSKQPDLTADSTFWVNPVWVMGSYDVSFNGK
eukprot:scaffold4463_cov51-Attheya_sp.AAC.24